VLYDRRIAALRYQFPYMEKGARRPDLLSVAQATVRAAAAEAQRRLPALPLWSPTRARKQVAELPEKKAPSMPPGDGGMGGMDF
jgi:hypothetical protein